MHSLVKVLGNFKEYCQAINRATSTGAIDVIVVEQPDGEFLCSNFHVCFSMLGVLNSREKDVDIEINGIPLTLQMRLSDTGEAFFTEKQFENVPDEIYACNGTPQILDMTESGLSKEKVAAGSTQSLNLVANIVASGRLTRSKSCSSIDISHMACWDCTRTGKYEIGAATPGKRRLKRNCHVTHFSLSMDGFDNSSFLLSQKCSSENALNFIEKCENFPMRASSDGKLNLTGNWQHTPCEIEDNPVNNCRDVALVQQNQMLRQLMTNLIIKMGNKDTRSANLPESESMQMLDNDSMHVQDSYGNTDMPVIAEELDVEQEPSAEVSEFNLNFNPDDEAGSFGDVEETVPQCNRDFVALSLCGSDDPTDDEFQQHQLSYTMLCDNPELFRSPKLIIRIDSKYYPYSVATAHIMSIIAFKQVLPQDALERLQKLHKDQLKTEAVISSPTESDVEGGEAKRSWWHWKSKSPTPRTTAVEISSTDLTQCLSETNEIAPEICEVSNPVETNEDCKSPEQPQERKIFKLSSEIIKKLNLKKGKNSMEFSVTTAFQGTTRCQCSLYLWKYDDKIIVSDIDGTITKSDVLGHLLPMVGKDWSQLGVAQLFTKIVDNGYKILYVSSRAIGQAKNTREYLNWVRQDNTPLPEGPVLISPTSMLNTLHRELIERKPELFKIACLEDISALFPQRNPFYAGYGNRINDVVAYCHVGIPKARIFTINYKGEITLEQMPSLRSSYLNMANIVDHIFPPVNKDECDASEYFSCNYWREPISDLPLKANELYVESPSSKSGFRLRFH